MSNGWGLCPLSGREAGCMRPLGHQGRGLFQQSLFFRGLSRPLLDLLLLSLTSRRPQGTVCHPVSFLQSRSRRGHPHAASEGGMKGGCGTSSLGGYLEESLTFSWAPHREGCLCAPSGGHLRMSSYNVLAPESMLWVAPQGSRRGPCTKAALQGKEATYSSRYYVSCHRSPSQILAPHLL